MPLKSFKEIYALDISGYVQKKPTFKKEGGKSVKLPEKYWLDYIEWATALTLLYENGAEKVEYEFLKNNEGYPAFFHNGQQPFIFVSLKIDAKSYLPFSYPVINGNRVDSTPNQLVIGNAQQRGLVKCIAVNTGLGLKLWQKEESKMDTMPIEDGTADTLPELTPDKLEWPKAIKALKNGYKITDIEKQYYLTLENRDELINSAI